jgi:regulation of enolase protein 1 (concanavalin A-like superfamily)
VCLLVCLGAVSGAAEAANRTVCASGCDYSSLQTAINDAVGGDVILLRAGETFVGNFILRAKSSSSSAFITIRSDAPDSSLPPEGVRLIPHGKPGANVAASALPRLLGQGGPYKSTAVIRTEPGAHHYRLQFLDIDGTANLGYETLIQLGENSSKQTTAASAPYAFVLDRLYIHGHALKGMKRGVAIDTRSTDVINSYISDIKSGSDSQGIAGFNGAGPFRILNNYIEAAAENILFGGSDPKTPSLVPSDIEIRGNYLYKPMAWMNPIMNAPSRVTTTATSGGSLAADTYYFKVVAVMATGGAELVSAPSTEMAVSVGGSGAVKLTWSSVVGADKYRVYRGTASNGESVYTTATTTSMTYTGSGETAGAPKSTGTRWTSKNLLELKNAQRVVVDGNVMENLWIGFQQGYAIVLTPRNQENTAPWSTVRNVTITHNTVRHVPAGFTILGYDDIYSSQQGRDILIANNLFYDLGGSLGNGRFLVMTGGPANVTVDHNTVLNDSTLVMAQGPAIKGFVYTNNLSRHNTYGVQGSGRGVGTDTLNAYFPSYVFRGNVLAGGKASLYPSGNFFPAVADFNAMFVNLAGDDFTLLTTSPFLTAATDGTPIGAVMAQIESAATSAIAGDPSSVSGTTTTPPPPPAEDPGELPTGWESSDIGSTGLAGFATSVNGIFTVKGAGTDIWGTADEFRFAYRTLEGDGAIVARVSAIAGIEAWTKVGVMIRANDSAGAAHAAMLVSIGKGLAFQRRPVSNGQSVNTSGGAGVAPKWVRLTRAGNVVTASVSNNGTTWTTIGSDTIALPATALVGLAVSSHTASVLATGTFDNVTVNAGTLPDGWRSTDIGAVGVAGSAAEAGGTFTVKGAGADVWGTADAAQFVSKTLAGDGSIVARVASISGSQAWTKAGVMMRMTLDAGSAQAFMLVSSGKGLAFQRRTVTGGISTNTSGGAGTAPKWVKLTRQGSVITASVSSNGTTWTVVGHDTFSITGSVEVGLAVSSHDATHTATATFDNVQ